MRRRFNLLLGAIVLMGAGVSNCETIELEKAPQLVSEYGNDACDREWAGDLMRVEGFEGEGSDQFFYRIYRPHPTLFDQHGNPVMQATIRVSFKGLDGRSVHENPRNESFRRENNYFLTYDQGVKRKIISNSDFDDDEEVVWIRSVRVFFFAHDGDVVFVGDFLYNSERYEESPEVSDLLPVESYADRIHGALQEKALFGCSYRAN